LKDTLCHDHIKSGEVLDPFHTSDPDRDPVLGDPNEKCSPPGPVVGLGGQSAQCARRELWRLVAMFPSSRGAQ
jgi:hypothetical protein